MLDELLLFTHPVVLGAGRPLFDALDQPFELDLLEQGSFDQGVTMHRYAVRGASSRWWIRSLGTEVTKRKRIA